jgi:ATP-dependent DNA helicase RecG
MNTKKLETLLNELESERIERKASISDRSKIRRAICAFANDLPNHQQAGVIFIGVKDDGNCANLEITDKLLLTLSDMRSNGNILPFPTMSVQKRRLAGCELAVIIVEPSDTPPVRYDGRVWVRVGPSLALATPEEERRLAEKRRSKDLPFNIQPLVSTSLDDLDLAFFEQKYLPAALAADILEQNQRPIEQQLASMRFINLAPAIHATVLGILVLGKAPQQIVPGSYIQFIRIDGTQLIDPIKNTKEITGSLSVMLSSLDETLRNHILINSDLTSQQLEIKRPDYPLVALQQLARNAVLHRTYEGTHAPVRITWFNDRIEIHNPGSPFGQVNRQNFGQAGVTDYRNPHLAEAMKNLGYVQRFGFGIPIARQALEENGNPPPEFCLEENRVLVTIRRRL